MTDKVVALPMVVSRDAWLAARKKLLEKEKEDWEDWEDSPDGWPQAPTYG